MKKLYLKLVVIAVAAMFLLSAVAGCGQQPAEQNQGEEKGKVTIGYVTWAEAVAVSNLWKEILETQGYQVELKQLDVAPVFVGLDQGDIDLFMDTWLPVTHQTYWEKYKNKLDDYGVWYTGEAKIGLVVPEYVTIDSIEELEANKDKFNGEIIGIDGGAGIMKAADRAISNYNLGFKLVQGGEAAMMSALDKAYRDNKWIAITGWSPHWKFAKYDLKYLEDPKGDFGESEELHTVATKDFTQRLPEVAEMIKKFKMDDQQIGTLEDLINQGMKEQDAAKKWIQDNQSVVDSWIK